MKGCVIYIKNKTDIMDIENKYFGLLYQGINGRFIFYVNHIPTTEEEELYHLNFIKRYDGLFVKQINKIAAKVTKTRGGDQRKSLINKIQKIVDEE